MSDRNFTSGITGDYKYYLFSLEYYKPQDAKTAFELSRIWNGLTEDYQINVDEYEDKFIKVKWDGNLFYPSIFDEKVRGSRPIRIFKIFRKNKEKQVEI